MSEINQIGFGAWQLGGTNIVEGKNTGWTDLEDSESVRLVSTALDLGINFFDTSDAYGDGKSEMILGKVIGASPDISICTKFGAKRAADTYEQDFSPNYAEKALHASLKRLRREQIAYFLLHSPTPEQITPELIIRLNQLKEQGKIGKIGISVSFLKAYQPLFDAFDCFEILYNPLTTQNLEFLPQLKNKEVFARSVFSSGLLLKSPDFWQKPVFKDYRSGLPPFLLSAAEHYTKETPDINARYKKVLSNCFAQGFNRVILGFSSPSQLHRLQTFMTP